MHGLIGRAVECFVRDTYGKTTWVDAIKRLQDAPLRFESMWIYDAPVILAAVHACAEELSRTPDEFLEDLGIYLVSHTNTQNLRRLLRFGGVNFVDFLHSLDDLPARARMAVSDLELPELELHQISNGKFTLYVRSDEFDFSRIVLGALRAMADDYGALVVMETSGASALGRMISLEVLTASHTQAGSFDLATSQGAA